VKEDWDIGTDRVYNIFLIRFWIGYRKTTSDVDLEKLRSVHTSLINNNKNIEKPCHTGMPEGEGIDLLHFWGGGAFL